MGKVGKCEWMFMGQEEPKKTNNIQKGIEANSNFRFL